MTRESTAYDNAGALGFVKVAAAGNRTGLFGTCTSIAFPARYGSVIAVTATDANNKIASTSCRGAEAALAAPGASIFSTVPTGTCASCTSSGHGQSRLHTDNINARGGGSYTYKIWEAGTPTCSNEVVVIF